ncbi:MAG: hypothetical protein OEN20_02085, partial [Gammaproteobacteria bacterium]|nr:hypothetical protein [Gammaproteobacteria bacterium]
RVLASPYCRTVQMAELMRLGPVSATDAVINMRVADYFGGRAAVTETASKLLGTTPTRGSNTVIIAHGNVALATFGFRPAEGEAVILRPDVSGDYAIVGRLTAEAFVKLGERAPRDSGNN